MNHGLTVRKATLTNVRETMGKQLIELIFGVFMSHEDVSMIVEAINALQNTVWWVALWLFVGGIKFG